MTAFFLWLALRDGAPDFFFGAGLRTEFTLFTAPDPIAEDTWTHIAATRDANVVRIYVDGAVVLERLDAAGALDLGGLHMSEWAFGPTGHNEHFGPCHNPWNPDHISGGSSSG